MAHVKKTKSNDEEVEKSKKTDEENKSEKSNTTEKSSKKTQKSDDFFTFRWYHFASLAAVVGLVVIAGVVFFNRYDLSLIGSERMLRTSFGCTEGENIPNYRYFGVSDGDLFTINSNEIKRVEDKDTADLELVYINGKPTINVRINGEWQEKRLTFGEEGVYVTDENAECKPGITVHLSA